MKSVAAKQVLSLLLPIFFGAVGGFVATAYPVAHSSFCAGRL